MSSLSYIAIFAWNSIPLILISFLWDLVFWFIGVGLIYLILVFIVKRKRSNKERTVIVLKKDIVPLVSTLLFHENAASRNENEDFVQAKVLLHQMLKNSVNRKMFSEILMDLQADLTGDAKQRLIKIFQHYDLHLDAIKRLKSLRWEVVCRGINELTQMQVNGAYIYIRKFINDNRSIVRKQAQLATVALKHEGINYFLDTATCKISEWQQLKLLETLQGLDNYTPPHFRLWLTSKNKFVVLFALRLIKSFEQDDAMESILILVKHRDDSIKIEAIDCLRAFEKREALPLFKAVFWICHSKVKLALLSAIGHLGTTEEIPFLKEVEQREKDHLIKSKAIGTINALAPETILPTNEIIELLDNAGELPANNDKSSFEDSSKPINLDEIQGEFEEVLKSPDFQKYDNNGHEENLALDLISRTEIEDLPVVAQDVGAEQEVHFSDADESLQKEESKTIFQSLLKTTALQMEVKTTQFEDTLEPIVTEDYIVIEDFAEKRSFERNLLDFAGLSELTVQTNYVYKDDGDREGYRKDEVLDLYVISDEVFGMPETPDFLEPDFEFEWSEQSEEDADLELISGPVHFIMDVYPESFKTEIRSLDQILNNKTHSSEEQLSSNSAFEPYYHASDMDGKLTLLDDISRFGDERDIPFLRKLKDDKSAKIRHSADQNINILIQRLLPVEDAVSAEFTDYDANPVMVPEFAIAAEYESQQAGIRKTGIIDQRK